MWSVANGREMAVVSAKGTGVRPCVFFKDSVRVASAQDESIMVSPHTHIHTCVFDDLYHVCTFAVVAIITPHWKVLQS